MIYVLNFQFIRKMVYFSFFCRYCQALKIDLFKRVLTAILKMQQRDDCYFLTVSYMQISFRNLKSVCFKSVWYELTLKSPGEIGEENFDVVPKNRRT